MSKNSKLFFVLIIISLIFGCTSNDSTCNDGVKNQDETGIDCGGSCQPCTAQKTTTTMRKSCDEMSEPDKSECLAEKAELFQDIGVCNRIENDWWKQNCILGVAYSTNNDALCDGIMDSAIKNSCYKKVAVETENSTLCLKLSEVSEKDSCFYRIGLESLDQKICEGIESPSSKYRCMAIVTKNTTICDSIDIQKGVDFCYLKLTELEPVRENCEKIATEKTQNVCYKTVAVKKVDSTLCEKTGDLNQQCLIEVREAAKKLRELNEKLGDVSAQIVPK